MEIKVRSSVLMSNVQNDREYIFSIPFGAPYDEAKEVAQQFMNGIDELRKQNEKIANEANQSNQDSELSAEVQAEPKSE